MSVGVLSCEVLVIISMCSSYFSSFLKFPKRCIFPRQHPTKRRTHDSKSLRVFLILAERGNFTCSMQVSPMFWVTGGISCAAQVKSCTDTGNCVLSGCTTAARWLTTWANLPYFHHIKTGGQPYIKCQLKILTLRPTQQYSWVFGQFFWTYN